MTVKHLKLTKKILCGWDNYAEIRKWIKQTNEVFQVWNTRSNYKNNIHREMQDILIQRKVIFNAINPSRIIQIDKSAFKTDVQSLYI